MLVFEQPRDDVRAFAMTYNFRCGARRYQSRDALFYTTANTQTPQNGVIDDWSPVGPGSVGAVLLEAACNGQLDSAARRIAGAPMAEAARMFSERGALAQATPPRAGSGGLMSRDQLTACLRQNSGPASAACQQARASAARGRATRTGNAQSQAGGAATGRESHAQLLDRIVQADSQDWELNTYIAGSMQIADLRRDARGNIAMLRGNYRYGRRTTPGLPYWREAGGGWVEARFVNGRLQCLQYHDRPRCVTSTRDFYDEGNEAARERQEYCAITRNC